MSEIQSASQPRGKIKSRKFSTRIDMTPMVDLAFLLLTFFILTAEMHKKFVMQIDMPEKPKDTDVISASKVLTIIADKHNTVYWFNGPDPVAQLTDYSADGISRIIREKNGHISNMLVLIKATDDANYKNLVDILDEMIRQKISRYAIADIDQTDRELLQRASTTK